MATYQYFSKCGIRYDLNLTRFTNEQCLFDSITPLRYECKIARFDVRPFQLRQEATFFSSDSYRGVRRLSGCFDVRSEQFLTLPQYLTAISYQSGTKFVWNEDFLIWQQNGVVQQWNSIDDWTAPRTTGFQWSSDLRISYKEYYPVSFNADSIHPFAKFSFGGDYLLLIQERIANRFNAIPCDYLFRQHLRWDSFKKEFAILPIVHQSLVRPGWKILARNLLTDECFDMGFIDADSSDHSLTNVFLPDGDYEVSVLTSSLFWNDCADRSVRTIAVRDDIEITPLPVIYNLRSSISQGTTTIQWSANQSGIDDCVFGLWYSSESPVDTNRPPDETVWYFPTQSEYMATFQQHEKTYLAVAAMRTGNTVTGNESDLGNIHELFLDWNNIPPHSPDDVMVFDPPLPAVDTDVLSRHQDESDVILWQ
ncbi:hypothetical protein FACS189427_11870 [Planctomycetales bacterium]|nr:hypothetical protein FACS189427_11870 [Planctomycetales bacterium]